MSSHKKIFIAILKKLIHNSSGRFKLIVAVIGFSVAVLLMLLAVQIQVNYQSLLNNKSNKDSIANFLVINKELTSQNIGNTALSTAEIKNLQAQPFTEAVGLLIGSRFKASIQSSTDKFPFYTDIAFESVGDEFIDVQNEKWKWTDEATYIPMIVPNMFLDIYNFQFSLSQGLPQITPAIAQMLTFTVNINSATGTVSYPGRIVGFSNRISSILVPQNFMQWANQRWDTVENEQITSRIIIKTKDPGSPALVQYLKQNGLVTDADKTRFSKYRQIVNIVVNVSWVSGAIMLLFALLIFTLFIQLTIASCKEEINLLVILGVAPKQLSAFLMRQFMPFNMVIIVVGLILVSIAQWFLHHLLQKQNIFIDQFISVYTIALAVLIIALLWLANYFTIKKQLP